MNVPQLFNGVTTETGKTSVQHQTDEGDNLFLVRPDGQVSLDTQVKEPPGGLVHRETADHTKGVA